MKIKLTFLSLISMPFLLTLFACDASVNVQAPKPASSTDTTAENTPKTPKTCPSVNSTWQCSSNCGSLPFNRVELYTWSGSERADISDFDGNTLQNLGCYNLGGQGVNPLGSNELRLGIAMYACPQKIPQNEIYEATLNCDKLTINGVQFEIAAP